MEIEKLTNPREVDKFTFHNKSFIRTQAIKRLGEIGDTSSMKRLIQILTTSRDKYDLIYSSEAIGKLKAKSAVPVLIKLIHSKTSDVACTSIHALGEIGDRSVIPILQEKMKHPRVRYVKECCEDILKKFGTYSIAN